MQKQTLHTHHERHPDHAFASWTLSDAIGAADTARGLAVGIARELAARAEHAVQHTASRARDALETNPVVISAAAIAAGVGVGLALPSREPEEVEEESSKLDASVPIR
jgi:hypothetical protein